MIGFKKWLIKNYVKQMSPIGTLAREVAADDTFPGHAVSKYVLLNYLKQYHVGQDCIDVFSEAWELYRKEMGITVKYQLKINLGFHESNLRRKKYETLTEAKQEILDLYWEEEYEYPLYYGSAEEEMKYFEDEAKKMKEFLYSEEKCFEKYEIIEIYYCGKRKMDPLDNLD